MELPGDNMGEYLNDLSGDVLEITPEAQSSEGHQEAGLG